MVWIFVICVRSDYLYDYSDTVEQGGEVNRDLGTDSQRYVKWANF